MIAWDEAAETIIRQIFQFEYEWSMLTHILADTFNWKDERRTGGKLVRGLLAVTFPMP